MGDERSCASKGTNKWYRVFVRERNDLGLSGNPRPLSHPSPLAPWSLIVRRVYAFDAISEEISRMVEPDLLFSRMRYESASKPDPLRCRSGGAGAYGSKNA